MDVEGQSDSESVETNSEKGDDISSQEFANVEDLTKSSDESTLKRSPPSPDYSLLCYTPDNSRSPSTSTGQIWSPRRDVSPEPEKRIYIDKYKPYRKNLVPRGDFQSLPGQIPENPDKPETLHSLVVTQGEKLKYRSTILIQRPREVFVPTAIVPPAPQELVEPSEEPGPSATSDSNTEEICISGSPPPVRRSRSQHIALTGPSGILGERDLITNSTFRVPGK